MYTSANGSRTSDLFHQNTHCSYDKTSEDASVSARITMNHGHTKVAAVPIDGFKQSTSPRGVQGSDN